MIEKNKKKTVKKSLTIFQIGILVLGIVAIGYAIGSSLDVVGAAGETPPESVDEFTYNMGQPSTSDAATAQNSQPPSAANGPTPKLGWALAGGYSAKTGLDEKLGSSASFSTKTDAKSPPGPKSAEFGWGNILNNVLIAVGIAGAIQFVGPFITDDKKAIDAVSVASMVGYFAGKTSVDLLGISSWAGLGIGAAAAGVIFVLMYKRTQETKITYTCAPWDAPTGGRDCEKCNEGELPCTEYQCRSLGQACELINEGTGEEKCIWKSEGDVEPPIISPWEDALLNEDYSYTPDNRMSPPDRGVYIDYDGDCMKAFTPFTFGITLNEPAKCKVDTERKGSFDEMKLFFGGSSTLKYNHTQIISLPSPEALEEENLTLQNDGNFELYVRCQDANGNSNVANFVFKYCVDKGPDTTAPLIVGTNIDNNKPVAYNQSEIDIELYVNEPAECRWNHDRDTSFENMQGTFICSQNVFEMNAQMLYKCSGTLNGIKDRQKNNFYFRCKDKPSADEADRNENTQGYEFTVIGTQPLVIDSVGPNETVKDSTETVKVTLEARTSAGYDEGNATCYYSQSCYKEGGSKTDYTAFYYEEGFSSYEHSQDLWLLPGTYECSIKCVDLGGNADSKEIVYTVERDNAAPDVVRAYHEDSYLKITTNEEANCVFGISGCNYEFVDGIIFNTRDGLSHFVNWDSDKTYYVKCEDEYGNQPYPDSCSIIIRPGEEYE